MYDELIKRLRYCSEEQSGCGMCALSSDCVLRIGLLTQAADAIEELQKAVLRLEDESGILDELPMYQQPVGWIPVTEHKPNKDDEVIIYGEWVGASGTHYREVWMTTISDFEHQGYKPIAWMPLPEPPKEE